MTGAGADIAAAAAGCVSQLAVNGLSDHLDGHEGHVVHALVKLLVLAAAEKGPEAAGQLPNAALQVLDHAAAHAAMALWALTTNPNGEPWAVRVASDAAFMQVRAPAPLLSASMHPPDIHPQCVIGSQLQPPGPQRQ
jgi:hypothetical protein